MYNYIKLCIIVYEQFFLIFPNFFFKTNNAKIIPLITFNFTLLLLFITLKVILQKKKRCTNRCMDIFHI